MLTSLRIPVSFLVIGILWALFSNPIITFFYRHLAPAQQDSYRSLNDLIFVLIISYVLYVKIKNQQRKLAKSEEEYRQLFESNPNPLWIYNEKSLRFVKVNNAALEKYGYTRRKFLKMTIDKVRPAGNDPRLKADEQHDKLRQEGIWKHIKSNGEIFDVSIITYPVLFNGMQCDLVMATDLTELMEKERKLEIAYQKIKTSNEVLLQIAWSNSHELRKPLCSIISLIDFLKEATSNQERKEYLQLLEKSSSELDQVLKHNNERVDEIEMQEAI